jgi:hypothetical protein
MSKKTLTKDEAQILLAWARTNRDTDLAEYSHGQPTWQLTHAECRDLWNQTIRKLKAIAQNRNTK